jgi:hypothetical protein
LHPANRINGVRRGQHWRIPLVDPLLDSVFATMQKVPELQVLQVLLSRGTGPRFLDADVLKTTQTILRNGQEEVCLVIESRGDQMTAHTWLRETDGLVLRQDATFLGEQLILERD